MCDDICGYWFALAWMSGLIDWLPEDEKKDQRKVKKNRKPRKAGG